MMISMDKCLENACRHFEGFEQADTNIYRNGVRHCHNFCISIQNVICGHLNSTRRTAIGGQIDCPIEQKSNNLEETP